ncbi:Peroxynitrite Isomerase Thap4 [Manis pentadactyla]|nr:Peroxynitrite Isomerase Thap4 [Manis pentadactyla]
MYPQLEMRKGQVSAESQTVRSVALAKGSGFFQPAWVVQSHTGPLNTCRVLLAHKVAAKPLPDAGLLAAPEEGGDPSSSIQSRSEAGWSPASSGSPRRRGGDSGRRP